LRGIDGRWPMWVPGGLEENLERKGKGKRKRKDLIIIILYIIQKNIY